MPNTLLEPNFWSIKQVFDFQYSIPVYQRPYSWQARIANRNNGNGCPYCSGRKKTIV